MISSKFSSEDMVSIESIWTNVIFQTRHCTTSLWCHVMPYSVSREQPKATQRSWWTHVVIQTDVSFPVASYSFTTLWSPLYFLPLFLSHILYTLCYCVFPEKKPLNRRPEDNGLNLVCIHFSKWSYLALQRTSAALQTLWSSWWNHWPPDGILCF